MKNQIFLACLFQNHVNIPCNISKFLEKLYQMYTSMMPQIIVSPLSCIKNEISIMTYILNVWEKDIKFNDAQKYSIYCFVPKL